MQWNSRINSEWFTLDTVMIVIAKEGFQMRLA